MMAKFRMVCATRSCKEQFSTNTALGRSLTLYKYNVDLRLFASNSVGLPTIYNSALRDAAADPAIMIFVHDDVHLCDFLWPYHLVESLEKFDIVGVAGNCRRVPNQPAWHLGICNQRDQRLRWVWDDPSNLSGIVGHGSGFPPTELKYYGDPRREVKLLDGVMLAARSETLLRAQLMFDECFDFHFYDMDFCRQAERSGLRMGTCGISLVHESPGNTIGDEKWRAGYAKYLQKWQS